MEWMSDISTGIFDEVEDWVNPLVSNVPLHKAYLDYTHPPRTLEKLKSLTTFVSTGTNVNNAFMKMLLPS